MAGEVASQVHEWMEKCTEYAEHDSDLIKWFGHATHQNEYGVFRQKEDKQVANFMEDYANSRDPVMGSFNETIADDFVGEILAEMRADTGFRCPSCGATQPDNIGKCGLCGTYHFRGIKINLLPSDKDGGFIPMTPRAIKRKEHPAGHRWK